MLEASKRSVRETPGQQASLKAESQAVRVTNICGFDKPSA